MLKEINKKSVQHCTFERWFYFLSIATKTHTHTQSRHINRMKNNQMEIDMYLYIFQFNWEHCCYCSSCIFCSATFDLFQVLLLLLFFFITSCDVISTRNKKKRRVSAWKRWTQRVIDSTELIATINKWKANKIKRIWRYFSVSLARLLFVCPLRSTFTLFTIFIVCLLCVNISLNQYSRRKWF